MMCAGKDYLDRMLRPLRGALLQSTALPDQFVRVERNSRKHRHMPLQRDLENIGREMADE